MNKIHEIAMLDSNNKSLLGFLSEIGKTRKDLRFYNMSMPNILDSINQHLYLLSNDIIQEDDWFIRDNYIQKATYAYKNNIDDKLVIASSDDSLNLPTLSSKFIKKYVELYNKNECITKVNVMYIEVYDFNIGDKLKVINDVYMFDKGSIITVKSFNHCGNSCIIEIEEDDAITNTGMHVSHLEYKTKTILLVDENDNISVGKVKSKESKYKKSEVINILKEFEKFVSSYVDNKINISTFNYFTNKFL